MNTMNLLTETDMRLIACHYNTWKDVDTDDLSDIQTSIWIRSYWSDAKTWLSKVLKGQLIISKPFSSSLASAELKPILETFATKNIFLHRLLCAFRNALTCYRKEPVPSEEPISDVVRSFADTFTNSPALICGIVDDNSLRGLKEAFLQASLDYSKYIPKNIKAGMKISKALNSLSKEYMPDNGSFYEDFRIQYSRILNQKNIKGELCLSIHPMDYLTMSDNTYSWGTCMSWGIDGCRSYRSGTLSVMESPYVVVAYLTGSEEMEYSQGLSWNSKKWRELFYVTPDMVVANTQYPYNCSALELEAFNWIVSLVEEAENKNFTETPVYIDADNMRGNEVIDGTSVSIKSVYNGNMYSDFGLKQAKHLTKYTTEWLDGKSQAIKFDYADDAHCPYCGGTGLRESTVCCPTCDPDYYAECCVECGCELDEYEDGSYRLGPDGELYCYDCWQELFVYCAISFEATPLERAFCILPPVRNVDGKIQPLGFPTYYHACYLQEFIQLFGLISVSADDTEEIFGEEYIKTGSAYRVHDRFFTDTGIDLESFRANELNMRSPVPWVRSEIDLTVWK